MCPHYEKCGGCQFMNMKYSAQLDIKKQMVVNSMQRIGGFDDFSIDGIRKGITKISEVYRFMNAEENLKFVYPVADHNFPQEIREESYEFIDSYLKK